MEPILFIDRETGELKEEKILAESILKFLYGTGKPLNALICRFPIVSALIGWWYQQPWTKRKILPFIREYGIDSSEFLDPIESFRCFNDFFIRRLKKETRPIQGEVIIPADGRYLFFQNFAEADGIHVKGKTFNLAELLQDQALAQKYHNGTLVLARLCPTDYHRFHFPVDCTPSPSRLINGYLYSVNPIALKQNIHILSQNKRMICTLESEIYGDVLFIEVGATNVGSIFQTYTPNRFYKRGEEKGYFAFGASSIILLFEPGKIRLEKDLINKEVEVKCLMGQKLGLSTASLGKESQ